MKLRLQKNVETQKELTSQDIAVAETLWIKEIQKSLSKNPKFEMWKRQFGVFTDEHGLMRCMGRLSQAQLPASAKYPILLDKSHYITSLFVRDSHKRVMHGGVKLTLTELRSRFWIVQGRQFVRKLLYECVHDEDQPRGKWRIGKVETLVTGSDGHVRGAVVRVKTKAGRLTRLRRPV